MNSENENKPEDKNQERDDEMFFKEHHRRHRGFRALWIFAIAGIILLKAGAVLLLWNNLIPELFHGPEVTFLQAIELVVLAKILFGFRGGMHWGGRFGGGHRRHWHRHWSNMTPEEREKVREHLKHRRFGCR